MGLEEVIGKAEGNEHLVGYTHGESSPLKAEMGLATCILLRYQGCSQPMTGVN
jgi:hypothetical protein